MPRLFFILFLLSVGWAEGASAKASSCEDRVLRFVETVRAARLIQRENVLSVSDREQIQTILANGSSEEAFKAAMDIYLSARLRGYSTEVRQRLLSIPIQFRVVEGREAAGNVSEISMPKELAETALKWIVFAHEFEHIVQLYEVTGDPEYPLRPIWKTPLKHQHLILRRLFGVRYSYAAERGAMQAEWEFANALPLRILEHARAALRTEQDVPPLYLAMFERMVTHAGYSQDEYVAAEHSAGRYSMKSIATSALSNHSLLWLAVFLFKSTPFFFLKP